MSRGGGTARPHDRAPGVACSVQGALDQIVQRFGTDLIGDGMLPNPGLRTIIEAYYSLSIPFWKLTSDYQFIVNPAYNTDRGPVSVIGARLRTQF
jgi:Carbohydrate-selective porin, OprB family